MMNTGTGIAPARNSVLQNRLNRLFDETFGPFTTQAPVSESLAPSQPGHRCVTYTRRIRISS